MNIDLIAAPLPVSEYAHDYCALSDFRETRLSWDFRGELRFIMLHANMKRLHAEQLKDADPARSRFLLQAIARMN